MEQLVNLAVLAAAAIVIVTLAYRLMPFREPGENKPRVAFFPKYTAPFPGSPEQVVANLNAMGFAAIPDRAQLYARGKALGDISARAMKLHASIDVSRGCVKIYAPLMGVLFDTGDLWQIATDAVRPGRPS